jgi:hypothetical protein
MGTLVAAAQKPVQLSPMVAWEAAVAAVALPRAWGAAYAAARVAADQRLRALWWAQLTPSVN